MRVTTASVPAGAGRANEDFTGATPTAAVLVDGAGIPGAEAVCRHGVAWYAHRLGVALLGLSSLPESLPGLLAVAITRVTDAHRDTCDVADPISPSAAVAVVRLSGDQLEHLILGDAVVVLDRIDGPPVVSTDRREVVVSQIYQRLLERGDDPQRVLRDLRANRNRPGGFWVAKDDPRAADEAVTGRLPVTEVSTATLLSNGASRIVDRFALTDWPGLLTVLASTDPAAVIDRVRQAEESHAVPPDDATITHCTALASV